MQSASEVASLSNSQMDWLLIAAAAAKLTFYVAVLSIAGLSAAPCPNKSSSAFLVRVFLGTGLLSWLGLILAYFAPASRFVPLIVLALWPAFVWVRRGSDGVRDQLRPMAEVLVVQLLACLLVLGAGFLYGGLAEPLSAAAHRWFHWTADNSIPLTVFNRLTAHDWSLMPGQWQISDRPPLQTAFFSLLAPLGQRELDYQLVGIVCQSFALTGVHLLLRALAIGNRLALAVIALLAPTGFVLMNAFFVWPKLLSAGYLCAAAGVLFGSRQRSSGLIAGALAGLGLLAHGGAFFAVSALLLVALFSTARARLPLMLAAVVVTVAPWMAFTQFVDPPGNRLAKWHLAGVTRPDPRGVVEAIIDSYKSRNLQQIVEDKLENARAQVGPNWFLRHAGRLGDKSWWDIQFGILGFAAFPAWMGIIMAPLYRGSRKMLTPALRLHALWLTALTLSCLLMFGPALDAEPTVAHARPFLPQQSYFIPLVALASTTLAGLSLPGLLRFLFIGALLLVGTMSYFYPPVGVTANLFTTAPSAPALALSLLALTALAWFFTRPLEEPDGA